MKKLILLIALLCINGMNTVQGIVPARPGFKAPQVIIDRAQAEGDRFYPKPALAYTMQRYAAAKRSGLDEVDDVNAYSPVICGKYSNSGANQWPISALQQELFDGPWLTGTMTEYWEEVSYNQFHLDGTVSGWYTSTLTQSYVVGNNFGFGDDAHLDSFLIELLDFSDPEVNFGLYDSDGPDGMPNSGDDDGLVDACFFVHHGAGAETGANNIWSHSSNLYWLLGEQYYYTDDVSPTGDTIKVGPYIIMPAVNAMGGVIEIGVYCHEYGHALGLPDLYDTDYSSEGVGVWSLMGSGSWNTEEKPAHLDAWCRSQMGWITPIEVGSWLNHQPIAMIASSGEAYKVWTNGVYDHEYFLVENRETYGFDAHLLGEGALIWHVDETGYQPNEDHPLVDLEEADGLQNLHYGLNRGDAGDIYPGISDNHWFDEYTNPNSLNYQNYFTQVSIWDLSDPADTMTANLDAAYSQPRFEYVTTEVEEIIGNDDGRADPGETVQFWVVIENLWANSETIELSISCSSPYALISDSISQIGALSTYGVGSNADSPFQMSIAPETPPGYTLPFMLHLSAGATFNQEMTFPLQVGRAPVLLVDDDQGEGLEAYLAAALDQTGILYEIWDANVKGSPGDEIALYETLLWMTGNDADNTLSEVERAYLCLFLEAGGNLILTGQNINEDVGNTPFFLDYLKCSPRSSSVEPPMLNGDPANALSSGMSLLAFGFSAANNQTSPSSVYPQEDAQPLFLYTNGEVAGVNYEDPLSGAHVVYLAFGLEAVTGFGGTTSAADLLNAIFVWANVTAVNPTNSSQPIPLEIALYPAYPNPFNPTTVASYELRVPSHVSLRVYDTTGRLVSTLVGGWQEVGVHRAVFDAVGLPSGVYLCRLQVGEVSRTEKMVLLK